MCYCTRVSPTISPWPSAPTNKHPLALLLFLRTLSLLSPSFLVLKVICIFQGPPNVPSPPGSLPTSSSQKWEIPPFCPPGPLNPCLSEHSQQSWKPPWAGGTFPLSTTPSKSQTPWGQVTRFKCLYHSGFITKCWFELWEASVFRQGAWHCPTWYLSFQGGHYTLTAICLPHLCVLPWGAARHWNTCARWSAVVGSSEG